jgi:alpha-glucosidase
MHDTLRFWLDRGVDGFRADVVHLIGKSADLLDDPEQFVGTSRVDRHDEPVTHELLRGIRHVLDGYPGERMMVGEVNLTDIAAIASYYGDGDELNLAFNFVPLNSPWDAAVWRRLVSDIESLYGAAAAWPTWVLSNHDVVRHRTRYGNSEDRARAAAVLLLTLRGTPFLYAGEELGLQQAEVPARRVVDPGGRDGCRAPLPWNGAAAHGWATANPWLPWPPDADHANVETLGADPSSILHLYRRMIAARQRSPALQWGSLRLLGPSDGMLGFERVTADDRRIVLVNFSSEPCDVRVPGSWTVQIASDGAGEGYAFRGRLRGDQAVVLAWAERLAGR